MDETTNLKEKKTISFGNFVFLSLFFNSSFFFTKKLFDYIFESWTHDKSQNFIANVKFIRKSISQLASFVCISTIVYLVIDFYNRDYDKEKIVKKFLGDYKILSSDHLLLEKIQKEICKEAIKKKIEESSNFEENGK